ncbi:MAG: hypothetical protein U0K80_09540 [Methanobrevibacter sp.]|nr:hypothetical protein [Methanobrevibacter sp.]
MASALVIPDERIVKIQSFRLSSAKSNARHNSSLVGRSENDMTSLL